MTILKKLNALLNFRHHIAARVLVSILISVAVITMLVLFVYANHAMNQLIELSVQSGQSIADTISGQMNSMTENVAQMHALILSSDSAYAYLYNNFSEIPAYDWFETYQDMLELLRLCGRSQYNLFRGIMLQKGTNLSIQYGCFNVLPKLMDLSPKDANCFVLEQEYAFYISMIELPTGIPVYLYSQIDDNAFDALCEGLLIPESSLVLLDRNGGVFRQYGEQYGDILNTYLDNRGDGKQPQGYHCVESYSDSTGLTVAMLFPAQTWSEMLMQLFPWLLPTALLALLAGFLLSVGFSRKVKMNFKMMEENIARVERREYNEVIVIPCGDEFGQLSQTFAHMAHHIDMLIRENQEQDRMQHEMEIQVLRAQISPHFLCNALNSVRYLASLQGMDSIECLSGALIRLLRASLSAPDTLVTLRQEIDYVRSYVDICQFQYLHDFRLEISIEKEIEDKLLPPMLIQPIVENAIIHGVADLNREGVVRVEGRRADVGILITVTDNGRGMTVEQIEELMNQEKNTNKRRFSGIGLLNVRKRIEMRFGEPWGLQIISEPELYTMVKLSLPCIEGERECETDTIGR